MSWWNQTPDFVWALFRDSREYPRAHAIHVTIGDGDLEQDILPHFMVKLPCGVDNLRYADHEDFGPMGRLYVRFETTPTCVDRFVTANGLRLNAGEFSSVQVPDAYGWQIEPTNVTYVARPDTRVQLTVSVAQEPNTSTVFLIAERY